MRLIAICAMLALMASAALAQSGQSTSASTATSSFVLATDHDPLLIDADGKQAGAAPALCKRLAQSCNAGNQSACDSFDALCGGF